MFVFDCHKAKWNNFNRDISIWKEKNKAKCCFHRVFASSINSFSSMYFVFFFTETFTFHFRMFLYMCRKFWIAKTSQFSQLLFIPLISPPPLFPCSPLFPPTFPLSFTPLFRNYRRYPLLQLIRKPIYCQSRSAEWLASWISARLLNTCNIPFLFLSSPVLLPRRTHADIRFDSTDPLCPFSSFSWLTVCGWIVMPFTWVH